MTNTIVFDTIVIGIIIVFAILHLLKGGISSVLTVGSFVLALITAWACRDLLIVFYARWITYKPLAIALSMLSIFFPLYIVLKIISSAINRFISATPLNVINRLIGFVYGAIKGFVLIVIFLYVAKSYNQFNSHSFYRSTLTGPTLEWGTNYMNKIVHSNTRNISNALIHSSHVIRTSIRHATPRRYKHYVRR